MQKVLDVLDRLFHYLAAIGFGCVTVCVLVQILARYTVSYTHLDVYKRQVLYI